jgi:DNA-nicking Smr family endonuclease
MMHMSFGKILNEWEKRGGSPGNRDREELGRWLDRYPPPADEAREIDADEKTLESVSPKKLRPQSVLDLHGLRGTEIEQALDVFIARCRRERVRKVLIVHGKGIHSSVEPVLGRKVREYLEKSPYTGAWGTARRDQGGSGAVWVMIRQSARDRKK